MTIASHDRAGDTWRLAPPRADEPATDNAFAWKEERTLSQALTPAIRQGHVHSGAERASQGGDWQTGHVVDYPDGRLAIRYRGVDLSYRTFDKIRQVAQAAIVENKQLSAALAFIREEQLRRGPERRGGPCRRDQHDTHLFKVG